MAGAQVPLPKTVLEEWVKGEPDPHFHDSDELKRHPAIAEDEAIVRAIRSNLYVGEDMVHVSKNCYGNLVSQQVPINSHSLPRNLPRREKKREKQRDPTRGTAQKKAPTIYMLRRAL